MTGWMDRLRGVFGVAEQRAALDARAHEHRADSLADIGRHDEALADIDRALSLKATEYRHYRRGAILVELARYPEAIQSLDAALALEPNDAVTLERRATALLMLDEPTRALADLERALSLKPNSGAIKAALGSALARTDPERALAQCNAALAARPDFPPTLNNRAHVHIILGNRAAAMDDLDRAIALASDEPIFRRNRAVLLMEAGRLDDAEADLARGLAADAGDPDMLAVFARVSLLRGDLQRARGIVSDVLARSPDNADAHCVAGWTELAQSRFAEAGAAFNRALAQPRGSHGGRQSDRVRWTALYGRGLRLQQGGQIGEGAADLDAARRLRRDADAVVAAWSVRPLDSGERLH